MHFTYPYEVTFQDNATLVEFPDVPGALTEVTAGEDAEAIVRDCLLAALGGYINKKVQPPSPSPPHGRPCVAVDLLTSAKLALATAMAEQGLSNVELAARLGVTEKVVRRLLDPDHRCRIDRLEAALQELGQRLELRIVGDAAGAGQKSGARRRRNEARVEGKGPCTGVL